MSSNSVNYGPLNTKWKNVATSYKQHWWIPVTYCNSHIALRSEMLTWNTCVGLEWHCTAPWLASTLQMQPRSKSTQRTNDQVRTETILSMLRWMLGSVKGVKSETIRGREFRKWEGGWFNIRSYILILNHPPSHFLNSPSPLGFSLLTPFTLPSMHLSMFSKHFRPHISACISVSFQTWRRLQQ